MNIRIMRLATLVCVLVVIRFAFAQTGGDYELSWSTIDGGGGTGSGGSYIVRGTIAQHDAAYSAGGPYELLGGFWPGGPICIVDFYSFARFAEQWLWESSELDADLSGDDDVDYEDLGLFVEEWLWYCPYNWPLK